MFVAAFHTLHDPPNYIPANTCYQKTARWFSGYFGDSQCHTHPCMHQNLWDPTLHFAPLKNLRSQLAILIEYSPNVMKVETIEANRTFGDTRIAWSIERKCGWYVIVYGKDEKNKSL